MSPPSLPPSLPPSSPLPFSTPSLLTFINMPDLLERVDNDHEFLRELLELFRTEFPRLQSELHDAVLAKNMHQAAKSAHMVKGMLANLSIEQAANAVEALEKMTIADDQTGAENALAAFDSSVVGLLSALDNYLEEQKV